MSPQVAFNPALGFGRAALNGIHTESIADLYWLDEDVEAEVDDDLAPDVTEILTSLCARRYGRRAAADRARRAVEAATGDPA